MARLIPLKDVTEKKLNVLFDSNTLIDWFKQKDVRSPVCDLIVSIAFNRRFTTELVAWEFFHPLNVKKEEIKERKKWLEDNQIHILQKIPSGYIQTFLSLLKLPNSRGDAIDAALAAHSIAHNSPCVVATINGKHFCWHNNIFVITDFLPSGACE